MSLPAVQPKLTFEDCMGYQLLYGGLFSPMGALQCNFRIAPTLSHQAKGVREFIEKYLSTQDKKVTVDLKDEQIQSLFDQAMLNMARKTIEGESKRFHLLKSLGETCQDLDGMLERCRDKSLREQVVAGVEKVGLAVQRVVKRSPILKGGVDAVYNGLTKLGAVSIVQEDPREIGTEVIAFEEDWNEIETNATKEKKCLALLKKWKKDPSLLLQTQPIKTEIDFLKNQLLPLVKSGKIPEPKTEPKS